MKFGSVAIARAAGLIAAHTLRADDVIVRKGRPIRGEDARRLAEAGLDSVVAVTLETGDVGEDEAAARLAGRVAGAGLSTGPAFTGRCNLQAEVAGILMIDRSVIDAVNAVDEAITLATLPPFRPVTPGEMVATVKIIPYAVSGAALDRAHGIATPASLTVMPYRRFRVGVVSTLLPGLKETTVAKTLRNLERRLGPTGAGIAADLRVSHEADAVATAIQEAIDRDGCDLVVVFGASAIADRRDVIPAGIEAAGGEVEHFGMPVDPGNLLLVGRRGEVPVIGAPGCARSPAENGFDWILHRLLAGLVIRRADIVGLGVGGLLMEIVSRPQPRSGQDSASDEGVSDDA
ncbi:molybdopterin-binding protein [Methylobacterium sp. 10]|uniref:molybdopterin-binding protein n=1 Tax=Methylobacterium sp. 10 TaxID=1101191 RepID=UPI0004885B62|nr:molybdopterin-binding protein [Methylobacterium sp. 10]